jgi:hypothetical protein
MNPAFVMLSSPVPDRLIPADTRNLPTGVAVVKRYSSQPAEFASA